MMTDPYQHLFDAAALEAGNLYGLWRARVSDSPIDPVACLKLERRLKHQLALLALASEEAGRQAIRTATEAGSALELVSAGWFCAAAPAALEHWLKVARTPRHRAALAAGIACAPRHLADYWVSKWSLGGKMKIELQDHLRQALGDDPDNPQLAWRTPPVARATDDPELAADADAESVRTSVEPGENAMRVAGSARCP